MNLEQILALLLVVATFVLVLATLYVAIATARGVTQQLQLATFAEYTRRYSELIDSLPFDAARPAASVQVQTLPSDERERLMKCMRRYFNLCWEEMHLRKSGKIDGKTWDIWVAGIRDTLRSPFFQVAWTELRPEYTYGGYAKEFTALIEDSMRRPLTDSDEAATKSISGVPVRTRPDVKSETPATKV